jgi:Trypsin-like peptidase domain
MDRHYRVFHPWTSPISLFLLIAVISACFYPHPRAEESSREMPIATQWLYDAAGPTGRAAITSVFLIRGPQLKGTGFLIPTGRIITNYHVIEGVAVRDLLVNSSQGARIPITAIDSDSSRDLAVLTPGRQLDGGLELADSSNVPVGITVTTWGHPLGYNGPPPLLAVGFLAGFASHVNPADGSLIRRLVVNGAFNPGISGGPLLDPSGKVIGVVVSKHAPIPLGLLQSLQVMQGTDIGIQYEAKDRVSGETIYVYESQLIAEWLLYFREMTQVVIGEAIPVEDLSAFLARQTN